MVRDFKEDVSPGLESMFDQIEKLKQEFTDKYVVVDARSPELMRFKEQVGIVKTVNMSGRALVEFLDFNSNIGWFDIDLSYLKVVDKPPEKKPEAKEKPAKPAAERPAATPVAEKAAAPVAGAKKPSVAEIMAAARAKSGAAPAAAPKQEAKSAAPSAAAVKKPSTADILAAARAKAAPATSSPSKPAPAQEPPPPAAPANESTAPVAPVAKKGAAKGDLPKTTVEKIAYCRKVDAK